MSSIEYRNSAISSTLQHMESTIENRKSQVLLAAQLIDNEVQNVRHLKRQSLGSIDLLVDPEMEYTVNQPGLIPERPQLSTRKTHNGVFAFSKKENNSKVEKVRHSLSEAQIDERYEDNRTVDVTSSTEGSKEEEAEDTANSTPREKPPILKSELSRNLLWVSADKHPSVKPRNYLQLVQNTLHQMSEHNDGDIQGSSSSGSGTKISKDDENTTGNDSETTRFEEDTEAIIRDTRRLSTLAKRPSRLRRSYIQFSEKEEEENERNEAAVTERRISLLEDRDDWKRRSINSDILINSSFASVNEINVTLKDLSDEITKISSKAGLTQDDAVTLATTLSMASSLSLEGDITRSTLETSDFSRDATGVTDNDEEYASALVDNDAKNTAKTSLLRGKCNRYKRRNSGAQGHESPWEVFTGDLGLTNTYQQEQEHEENGPKSASEEDKEEETSLRTILEDLGSSHYSSDSRDDTFSVHRATLDNQQVGPDGFTSEESFDQGSLIFGSDEFGKSTNGKPKLEVEPKLLPSPLIVKTEPLPLDTNNNSKDKNNDNNNNEEDHNDDKRTKKMWFWSMTKSKGDRSSEASKKQSTFESRMASLFRRREKHLVIGDTQTEVRNDDPVTPSTPRAPESNKGPTNRFSIFSRATAPQSNEATPSGSNLSSPNNIGETNDITGGFILSSLKKVRSLSFDNGKPHLGKNYRSISATSPSLSDTEQSSEVTDKQNGDQVQPRHLHHEKTKGRTASRLLEKISFQNDTTNSSKQKRNDGSKNNSNDKPVKCRARKPYYRQTLLPLQQQRQRQLQLELQFQQRRQREVALIQQKQREKEQQEQQQQQQKLQNPPDQIPVSNNGQNDDTGKASPESNKAVVTPRHTDQKQAQQPVVLRTRDDKKRSKRGPTHDCQGSSNYNGNGSDSGARGMHLPPRKPTFDDIVRPVKPNGPQQLRDSAFGFPLPSMTPAVVVMFDHRLPITAERAIYRLSHIKLGNPKRPLREQVLLSNFMYAYLNLVDHTLYMEQAATTGATAVDDAPRNNTLGGGGFPAMKSTAAGPSSPILPSQQTAIGA